MKINQKQHITRRGVVKRNPPKKNNLDILKPYREREDIYRGDTFFYVTFVPPDVAMRLTTGYPKLDLSDTQNNSPEARELIELAKKYRGWLGGYVVNDPKREDNRVTFDTLFLPIDELTARKIQKDIMADEFDKEDKKNSWRYWWD